MYRAALALQSGTSGSQDVPFSRTPGTHPVVSALGVEIGQPSQRLQPGHEEVFAAAQSHELRQSLEAPADGLLRDGEDARPPVGPNERISLGGRANEGALIDPLALDELELPPQVCADEEEDKAAS